MFSPLTDFFQYLSCCPLLQHLLYGLDDSTNLDKLWLHYYVSEQGLELM